MKLKSYEREGNLKFLYFLFKRREKTTIPRILKDCVEVIETKGIEEVGIYRVSSVVSEVQKMKDLYSKSIYKIVLI